jgi:hypothetical protein
MHQLLPLKVKIWIIVGLAALTAAIASLADVGPLSLGAVVGGVEFAIVYLLARSWPVIRLFSWLPCPGWAKANLSGKWHGTIQSQWRANPGDSPLSPIPIMLDLRQGWNEVVFSFETDKMRSRSSAAMPFYDQTTHELEFRYFFETSPTVGSSPTNPPQKLGCAIARFSPDRPHRMTIIYTNERGGGGDIVLERATSKVGSRRRKRPRASTAEAHG